MKPAPEFKFPKSKFECFFFSKILLFDFSPNVRVKIFICIGTGQNK